LTRNLDIYVNWNIGDDANDGTANVTGKALKNVQAAINKAFSFPPSQYSVNIHIADSLNYIGCSTPTWNGPHIEMIGNDANPQNVVITGQPNGHAVQLSGVNQMTVHGVTATTTVGAAGPAGGFVASNGASLNCYNTRSLYVYGAVFEAFQADINVG